MNKVNGLPIAVLTAAALTLALVLALSCGEDPAAPKRDNPLDPGNPDTGGDPFGLTATADTRGIRLEWVRPEGPEVAGFVVLRRDDGVGPFAEKAVLSESETAWTDSDVEVGIIYAYKVLAVGTDGRRSSSDAVGTVGASAGPILQLGAGSKWVGSPEVQVFLVAGEATEMRLGESPELAGEWESFAALSSWDFSVSGDRSDGDELRLYAMVRYENGVESGVASVAVTLDLLPPIPSIEIASLEGATVTVSAAGSVDANGTCPAESLQVRWDWDNDGTWDTPYSFNKTASHTYNTGGVKTIRLGVWDSAGNGDVVSRTFAWPHLVFDRENWEGVRYSRNVFQGPWLPVMDGTCADFAIGDFDWGLARTRFTVGPGFSTGPLSVLPRLSSGGVHEDWGQIGFGDGYSHYQGQRFVGVTFARGLIYLGTQADYLQRPIGVYIPGVEMSIELVVDEYGMLTVSGTGVSGSIDTSDLLPEQYHMLLTVSASTDGVRFCSEPGDVDDVLLHELFDDPVQFERDWNVIRGSVVVEDGWAHGYATGETDPVFVLADPVALHWESIGLEVRTHWWFSNDPWSYSRTYFCLQSNSDWQVGDYPLNGYMFEMKTLQNQILIAKFVSGVMTTLGLVDYPVSLGRHYHIFIVASDGDISVLVDGDSVIQVHDETFRKGTIGFGASTGGGEGTYVRSYYNSVKVTRQ